MRLDTPLLALVGASVEWEAGTPPTCSARMRLLDRVHFTVHRGDCVIVHHDDPAGARVLLAALAGHPALTFGRILFGERRCAPRVRIRRSSVRTDVIAPMLEGWRDADHEREREHAALRRPCLHDSQPVVHLLRASREGPVHNVDARQWRSWAARERQAGGAVVIVARPEHALAPVGGSLRGLTVHAKPQRSDGKRAARMRERGAPYESVSLRTMQLRHGRLFDVRSWP